MVTYSDLFAFVIMLCAVITLVINITHQKQRLTLPEQGRYFDLTKLHDCNIIYLTRQPEGVAPPAPANKC